VGDQTGFISFSAARGPYAAHQKDFVSGYISDHVMIDCIWTLVIVQVGERHIVFIEVVTEGLNHVWSSGSALDYPRDSLLLRIGPVLC
jgi:hypothetical protein